MSTTTSTTHTTTPGTVQPSYSASSSRRNSAGSDVPTTTPAQQPPSSTTAVPTTPTSRPSIPSTPNGTPSNPPSSPTKPGPKPVAKSKWLNHLSHISVATWIGVGLALGGLVVTIYYGIPMMRLAIWTAQSDFREACKSEVDAGLSQSAACNRTLAQPAQPPPIMKRTISDVEDERFSRELAPWVAATCSAFLLALCSVLKNLAGQQGKDSTIESPSLGQLFEAVLERTTSRKQAVVSLLGFCLDQEIANTTSVSADDLRQQEQATVLHVARCFATKETPVHVPRTTPEVHTKKPRRLYRAIMHDAQYVFWEHISWALRSLPRSFLRARSVAWRYHHMVTRNGRARHLLHLGFRRQQRDWHDRLD